MKNLNLTQKRSTKGIILAGGRATRLFPHTLITSKQMLPVYDYPMIFYPLNTLVKAGIRDILIIVNPEHSGDFMQVVGDIFEGTEIKISFRLQRIPRGLPEAFILGENHIDQNNVALILGDNIFEHDFSEEIKSFQSGGRIFATKVRDPERFGVVKVGNKNQVEKIIEKPSKWVSDYAVVGLYLYDTRVIEAAKKLKPSSRGETEIVDLHNWYRKKGELDVKFFSGAWLDAGTHEALLEAGNIVRKKNISQKFHSLIKDAVRTYCANHKSHLKKRLA